MNKKRIIFTGGGTAGHVYPGLAIIENLNLADVKVLWMGRFCGIEREIVAGKNLPYCGFPCGKLRRYFSVKNFFDFFTFLTGIVWCFFFFLFRRPTLVFSKGGFVAVPPVIAAHLLGIVVFTHESDIDPGLATKIIGRFARRIFIPWKESLKYYPGKWHNKISISGNPVRREFGEADPLRARQKYSIPEGKPMLLVLGGSSGAKEINKIIEVILPDLTADFFVVHQMGKALYDKSPSEGYLPLSYSNDIPDLMAAASLVICRSGAGTLAEIAAMRLPAILIPYTSGGRGDQLRNAQHFEEMGAGALFLPQKDKKEEELVAIIKDYFHNSKVNTVFYDGSQSPGYPAEFIARQIEGEC